MAAIHEREQAGIYYDKGGAVLNALHPSFNIKGDGTDETAKIYDVLTEADNTGQKIVFPKPPVHYGVTGSLEIPDDMDIEGVGVGRVEFQAPAGSAFHVFDVNGVSNVRIAGIKVTKAAGADSTGYGIQIRGNAQDIVLERFLADEFNRGVNISGGDGTVVGICERITLRDVRGYNSTGTYGFMVDECDVVEFLSCHARGNWLDGFKLRRKTQNVTIRGGSSKGNGLIRPGTGTSTGEGLDAYAGGHTFIIDGFVAESNYGNGITVKTDLLNETDPSIYGYIRNIQISNVICRKNDVGTPGATGLGVYTGADGSDLAMPVSADVTIHGGIYEDNNGYGIVTNCRNATIHGPVCKRNTTKNIWVRDRSFDVEIFGPKCLAAGYGTLASGTNLQIDGKHVKVWGGTYLGVDADLVKVESDLAALPVYTSTNILVSATADEVEIHDPDSRYYATSSLNGIGVSAGATGKILIHQRGSAAPSGVNGARGGIGSRYTNSSAAAVSDVEWIKTSGTPDVASTGWQRARLLPRLSKAIGVTQTTVAHSLGYTPSVVIIKPKGNAVVWESAAADATNVYLTASAATTVDIFVQ